MLRVSKLRGVSDGIHSAFLPIWIESKTLPLKVGHRPTLAAALRVLMPPSYNGPRLRLYRGATAGERRRRLYGFSWTTRIDVARNKFAAQYQDWDGSVVLETVAPPDAILLLREDEKYYDEGEVVIDPFKLSRVDVVERMPPRSNPFGLAPK
jgi:hypothetical protein